MMIIASRLFAGICRRGAYGSIHQRVQRGLLSSNREPYTFRDY